MYNTLLILLVLGWTAGALAELVYIIMGKDIPIITGHNLVMLWRKICH